MSLKITTHCSVTDCSVDHYSKGFCKEHYNSQYSKNYRIKNKKKLQQYSKEYRTNILTREKVLNSLKRSSRTAKSKYSKLLIAAKKKNIDCSISFIEYTLIIKDAQCIYNCGHPLPEASHGLDRIDNNKGYILTNVLPCCEFCNQLRGDRLTVEETIELISTLKEIRKLDDLWKNQISIGKRRCSKN